MKCSRWSLLLSAVVLTALSTPAAAHEGMTDLSTFWSGVAHPLTGSDHIAAMIAVGLWGAQLGGRALWMLPLAFPMTMAVGGLLGIAGVHLTGVEVVIALSAVVMGAGILAKVHPPVWVVAAMVAVFGLFHGYAHGAEMHEGSTPLPFSLGFILATGCLHATGIGLGTMTRWNWGQIAARVSAGLIFGAGLFFLWRTANL